MKILTKKQENFIPKHALEKLSNHRWQQRVAAPLNYFDDFFERKVTTTNFAGTDAETKQSKVKLFKAMRSQRDDGLQTRSTLQLAEVRAIL